MSREFFIPTNILLPFNVINNVRFAKILLWKHVYFAKILLLLDKSVLIM